MLDLCSIPKDRVLPWCDEGLECLVMFVRSNCSFLIASFTRSDKVECI